MKNLYLLLLFAPLISLYSGCSGHSLQNLIDTHYNDTSEQKQKEKSVNPSQNSALNTISPSQSQNDGNGLLQKKTDTFIKEDWTPTIEQNSTIKVINEDSSRDFKLQEYVDKAEVYLDAQPDSNKTSHKEKMDKMPAIGKVN